MAYLLCRIGWMETYASRDEPCFSHQRHIKDGNPPYEPYNFLRRDDGTYRGYVPVGKDAKREYGRIAVEKLGAGKNDSEASGVTVVFCASHQTEGGLRIVGFYRDATVLREPIVAMGDDGFEMVTRVIAREAVLIPEDERVFAVPGSRDGGFGQASIWYGLNDPKNAELRAEVEAYIGNTDALPERQLSVVEFRQKKLHLAWEGRAGVRRFIYAKGFQCEACDYSISDEDAEIWGSGFELHHLQPWADLQEAESRRITPDDFAVLCAVCHRAIHRTAFVSDVVGFRETITRRRGRAT